MDSQTDKGIYIHIGDDDDKIANTLTTNIIVTVPLCSVN